MGLRRVNAGVRDVRWRWFAARWVLLGCLAPAPTTALVRPAAAQTRPADVSAEDSDADPQSAASAPRLTDRQQAVRERVLRLEGRLLRLAETLLEREPAQAERVRDALDLLGRQRIRVRLDQTIELLTQERFGDAEESQQELLNDMQAVLERLSSTQSLVDRLRSEREQLEGLKRSIRQLMDQQTEALYRTERMADESAAPADAAQPSDAPVEAARALEQVQRELGQRAADAARQMQKSDEAPQPKPGAEAMQQAAEAMQKAADRLGERQAGPAGQEQKKSLDSMQQALNQLDDALRQVRQDEREETLTAIETRIEQILEQQRAVGTAIEGLGPPRAEGLDAASRQRVAEGAARQAQVAESARGLHRILVDEGTTVIVPELMQEIAQDMDAVAARLRAEDAGELTRQTMDAILAQLEELLAIVREQSDAARQPPPQPGPSQAQDGPRPLLPGSAELKLLKSWQVRLNERSRTQGVSESELRQLSQRQRTLVDLVRKMSQRP